MGFSITRSEEGTGMDQGSVVIQVHEGTHDVLTGRNAGEPDDEAFGAQGTFGGCDGIHVEVIVHALEGSRFEQEDGGIARSVPGHPNLYDATGTVDRKSHRAPGGLAPLHGVHSTGFTTGAGQQTEKKEMDGCSHVHTIATFRTRSADQRAYLA